MDNSSTVRLWRVFTDAQGRSHFGEIEVETSLIDFAPPAPPLYVSAPSEAKQTAFLVVPVGWYGEPHPAPLRQLMALARGNIEVTVSDGERRVFGSGDIVLLEDTSGEGHASRNIGKVPAVLSVTQY